MAQVGFALRSYESEHGHLPPAAVCGKDGKPLLSWRVLLLPFLEGHQLYEEFHLDEPWNSPHNLRLLARTPPNFIPPGEKAPLAPPGHTFLKVFTGAGTAFGGCAGRSTKDFSDPDEAVLLVEGGSPVPWTKPDDIAYRPDLPLGELATLFKDGFRVVTGDGHVRFIERAGDPEGLRGQIVCRSAAGKLTK